MPDGVAHRCCRHRNNDDVVALRHRRPRHPVRCRPPGRTGLVVHGQ
jgi:hypothetical protein